MKDWVSAVLEYTNSKEGKMIKNWSEIQSRFDEIKDHKPRASKKLNELGDILASAYAIDPDTANDMWQYIVDLNVSDDITFSKFYIAQVFNKLTDRMKPEDATAFLTMTPERVNLMINYGYDGGTLWHCLTTLMKGYLIPGDVDNAIICIGYFYDKFGGLHSGDTSIIEVAKSATKVCAELRDDYTDSVEEFLNELGSSSNEEINTYVRIAKAIYEIGQPDDYDELFAAAIDGRYAVEFFDLLWVARDEYDADDLKGKWIEYIAAGDEDEVMPWNYIRDDSDTYDDSKLKFYVDMEKDADELLERYFNRSSLYDVENGVVWDWIEAEDWERFSKYLSMTLMNTSEDSFEYSSVKRTIEEFMRACSYDDSCYSTDHYERNYGDLMKGKQQAFADALAKISAIAVGCEAQEDFHEFIKGFIQKSSGNLDALKKMGFDDVVETRSGEERLKEYVHDFLQSGELVHESRSTKYSMIMDAIHDDIYGERRGGNHVTVSIDISKLLLKSLGQEVDNEEDEEEEVDLQLESDYRLALDDEVAEFFFQHCPREYSRRLSLVTACVKKNDINRAIELIDMMAETENNDGYEERNGWGRQNMLTIMYLIREFEYTDDEDSWRGRDITDEMRQNVRELVYRMMPHLPLESQEELKKDLYKIDPKNDDADEYIAQLLEDATVYTTFPKPRGKGGAPNINRMSDEFIHCFERLSKMGRLDVVSEIMTKFAVVRDVLKPVTFDSWMSFMSRGLKSGDMVKIYRYNKDIFEAWLEGDNLRDWDIIRAAEGFANGCTREEFQEFRNLIIRHKGKIDGLDACFEATSENTETQLLFDGNTLKLSLDFVEVIGSDPVSNIELHFLSISKCRDLSSVRLIKCVINGIETDDCGFLSEMDEDPKIGYYIFNDNEEVEDSLTVYSDFFDDNDIDEVKSIVLRLVVMNDDAESIEEMTDIVIELDDYSGEYKVKQQAESTRCTADFSLDDDDDSDGSAVNIDISGILKKALADSLGVSLDDDEEDDMANSEEEIELDSDDFSDTSIYKDDNDVCVEFCGLEFDEDDETITLRIWCRNYSEKKKKFWIDNVEVDGESYGSIDNLGTVDKDDSDYCNCVLSDINYSAVDTIEFEIEIDDEENTELGRTRRVSIDVDTSDESFTVRIHGDATYSNYDNTSDEDDSEDEAIIEEDIDEFDDDIQDEDISIIEDEGSDDIFGGKISTQFGTLRELISFKDYELPFRVMRLGDSSKIYELQTIRDNAVYAEIFEDGESIDYCRFSINETQKFMIVEE
ncbi:MAG: hypothetical protein ACI4D0_08785 [Lachnospira sp.]